MDVLRLLTHLQQKFLPLTLQNDGTPDPDKVRKVHGKVMGHIPLVSVGGGSGTPSAGVSVMTDMAGAAGKIAAAGNKAFPVGSPYSQNTTTVTYDVNGFINGYSTTVNITFDHTLTYALNPLYNSGATSSVSPHTPNSTTDIVFMGYAVGLKSFTKGTAQKLVISLQARDVAAGTGLGGGDFTYTIAANVKDAAYAPMNSEFVAGVWDGTTYTSADLGAIAAGTNNPAPPAQSSTLPDASFDADKLDGLHARMADVSTTQAYIPVADGQANPNLVAEKLGTHGINDLALRADNPDADTTNSHVLKADKLVDKVPADFATHDHDHNGTYVRTLLKDVVVPTGLGDNSTYWNVGVDVRTKTVALFIANRGDNTSNNEDATLTGDYWPLNSGAALDPAQTLYNMTPLTTLPTGTATMGPAQQAFRGGGNLIYIDQTVFDENDHMLIRYSFID